jgi:hypothetical protein
MMCLPAEVAAAVTGVPATGPYDPVEHGNPLHEEAPVEGVGREGPFMYFCQTDEFRDSEWGQDGQPATNVGPGRGPKSDPGLKSERTTHNDGAPRRGPPGFDVFFIRCPLNQHHPGACSQRAGNCRPGVPAEQARLQAFDSDAAPDAQEIVVLLGAESSEVQSHGGRSGGGDDCRHVLQVPVVHFPHCPSWTSPQLLLAVHQLENFVDVRYHCEEKKAVL